MRAIRLFVVGLGAALLATGCGKDGTGPKATVTADFTVSCSSLTCQFTDASTANGGTIAGRQWDFGDGTSSTDQNPTHEYTSTTPDTLTVALTVTDNDGGTNTASKTVIVAPPATLACAGEACDLVLPVASTVTVTLQSSACTSHGSTFLLTAPIEETLFDDGCYVAPLPKSFQLNGGSAFNAGTHLKAEVVSGSVNLKYTPTIRVTGSYPSWTLEFDDGEGCANDPSCGGTEPDYDDLVITVEASPL